MASENDSYDDFDDSLYEDEIIPDDEKQGIQDTKSKQLQNNNMATWRKIEDFWDNYKLSKQINDDLFDEI